MRREPGPPDDGALPDEPQTIAVRVDVSGLPQVMALARAARDVVDRADHRTYSDGEVETYARVDDLATLAAAVAPIYPGPAT